MLYDCKFKCWDSYLYINEKINKIDIIDASRFTAEHSTFLVVYCKRCEILSSSIYLASFDQHFLEANNNV